ncbi:MAG: hypothetical protein A2Z18_02725 [Armatimonadetes bacterium RBG_16_58_9]|nr:MAG: hypothetical protein A2Z18_02725 [Armatimonadetes bacterium RBG_16_58_9]
MLDASSADVILNLVMDADDRTEGMMPGWDLETARQKMLFFTAPAQFGEVLQKVAGTLDAKFASSGPDLRERAISFVLGIAESLLSPVELDHNPQNKKLFGNAIMSDTDAAKYQAQTAELVKKWAAQNQNAYLAVTSRIKAEDIAVNKGDNLFVGWAGKWKEDNGRDPYANVDDYLNCFGALYQRGMYYPDLYFAREQGQTRTQFFNDYGLQAARCRRMGSLGGTTNPAIAVLGEDDLSGKSNIWGEEATAYVQRFPNKWHEVRKLIAKEQIAGGQTDDWAATKFTEWVVVDAMLGLRSVFLLKGLGRVAFQLRPDWHDDEKKLTYAGAEIYAILCKRMKLFDDILLEGADHVYARAAASRIGKSNNHFKIACTGQAALNVVRSFNAGHSETYPDAIKERMFTNMTLSYEVPQMHAASMATEDGIKDYEKRTGEKVDDGEGGSVVTSMIGRFNDAIRDYRVKSLLAALPEDSKFRAIDPATVKKLTGEPLNSPEFIAAAKSAGIDFDPESEEDAIDRAGTLCTKRVVVLLEKKNGLPRARILTASKRNFFQNTELLGVAFSTDFGNIQRMYMARMPLEITNWKTLYDDLDGNGYPVAGSVWAKRSDILSRIWPDWKRVFEVDGVKPEEYGSAIYVTPTLKQFIGMWEENVARASRFAEECGA